MSPAAEPTGPAGGDGPRTWRHLTILETLSDDAAATVYRAHDRMRQVDVALKLFKPPADPAMAAKAVDDARLRLRARHPNIAAVYGASEADGRVGVWMELVKGETLAGVLESKGAFDPRDAAGVGLALCGALSAVHDAGLLHGDVRAHKVMRVVTEGHPDRIVLLDFGAEPVLNESASNDAPDSHLLYLPPERFAGRPRTPPSDIYALGVLLFHLVTKAYPVSGRNQEEIRRAHETGLRRSLKDLETKLPQEFVHAVEHALATNPLDRYQTIGAVEVTLARYLGPDKKRNRWLDLPWTRVAAAIVVLGLAVAAGLAYRRARQRGDTPFSWVFGRGTPYTIGAVVYRESGGRARLSPAALVSPGDELSIEVTPSVPMHVYVVDEDDRGVASQIYPPPGQPLADPLPPNRTSKLPAIRATRNREHVLIFASPERLTNLPAANQPPAARPLALQFPTPLPANPETARGVWVRQITLEKTP